MNGQQSLMTIDDKYVYGALAGSIITIIAVTQFGHKVRAKGTSTVESMLGIH